ncbi:prenyltransferase [Natranaerobius thermophilus]|uniref:UbiA prenyltransferase n=1 Tax=Natranaerobius thermophilus (strain ATCC BAA-1301 / DSM 18059 / JW/NM-WN-LF) TaxID=457570 RepID=B2A1K7_NATTJ|nr:prenyltransferase [Natranaerobius thermophilus]ACB84747.1 UbiA prenyltransferase [Natranaerobius thermophilus JW/NM-WN-LF]
MKSTLYFRALRPFSFPTSIIPITIGTFWEIGSGVNWPIYLITLLCGIAIHGGTNLTNDYYDFIRGVDTVNSFGSSKLLPLQIIPPRNILIFAVMSFSFAFILSLILGILTSYKVTVIAVIGILAGYFYTGFPLQLKYRALGPVLVFLMMGPLLVKAGGLTQLGYSDWDLILISIPIACLVSIILQANDLRDKRWDKRSGVTTFAILFGYSMACKIFTITGLVAFLLIPIFVSQGLLPYFTMITWLLLPKFFAVNRKIYKGTSSLMLNIDIEMTKLYSLFGVIIIFSILI